MPIHTLLISTYPTMQAAFDARTDLIARFTKAHKRAEKVGLFIGSSGTTNPVNQLTVHYTREQEAEARWFAENVEAAK